MSESQECSKVKNFKAEIENELSHLKQNNSTVLIFYFIFLLKFLKDRGEEDN